MVPMRQRDACNHHTVHQQQQRFQQNQQQPVSVIYIGHFMIVLQLIAVQICKRPIARPSVQSHAKTSTE
jgi:hypothetical protein